MDDATATTTALLPNREVLLGYLEAAQRMGKIGTWDLDLVADTLFWTD